MFTGIIEGLGRIESILVEDSESRFIIHPLFVTGKLNDGASIAVNGACLSVEKSTPLDFTAYASSETLQRTNLSLLKVGSLANLEQALALGQRLGGHIVTGHIDCLASLTSVQHAGQSLKLRLNFPKEYGSLVIPKGSVALNGISLTVNKCGEDFLEVNIIPDSQKRTNISTWGPGDWINMETDIIGKYVRHNLIPWNAGEDVTYDFLAANGFV